MKLGNGRRRAYKERCFIVISIRVCLNVCRSITHATTLHVAVTVAARGASYSKASSPKLMPLLTSITFLSPTKMSHVPASRT